MSDGILIKLENLLSEQIHNAKGMSFRGQLLGESSAKAIKELTQAVMIARGGLRQEESEGGVWVSYYSDMSSVIPFGSKEEAVQHADDNQATYQFVKFGTDIRTGQ